MNRRLSLLAIGLFLLCLAYDLVTWGAVRALPDIGAGIADSAARESPLASTYIFIGQPIDKVVPGLRAFGISELTSTLADGLPQLREQPTASMDLIFGDTWSAAHWRLKLLYWAAPALLLVVAILRWLRPKPIRMMGNRR
ncbi:MAG: hypothetical protein WBW61_10460 [Rhodanobacteraceae bacterium]